MLEQRLRSVDIYIYYGSHTPVTRREKFPHGKKKISLNHHDAFLIYRPASISSHLPSTCDPGSPNQLPGQAYHPYSNQLKNRLHRSQTRGNGQHLREVIPSRLAQSRAKDRSVLHGGGQGIVIKVAS